MTEETPPSSLTVETKPVTRPTFADAAWTLRLSPERWDQIGIPPLLKAAGIVAGGWLLMAWSRFGFQGVAAPRAGTRFVLVGVYGWIGLAAVLWLGASLGRRTNGTPGPPVNNVKRLDWKSLSDIMPVVGLAHQPVVVAGVAMQVAQALPIPRLTTVLFAVSFLFWMPAMLAAAAASVLSVPRRQAAAIAIVGYSAWLATAGWFAYDQLAHLI